MLLSDFLLFGAAESDKQKIQHSRLPSTLTYLPDHDYRIQLELQLDVKDPSKLKSSINCKNEDDDEQQSPKDCDSLSDEGSQ